MSEVRLDFPGGEGSVPIAEFEKVDRERRALLMEADTYRQCIDDVGGLEQLCAVVREHVPLSPFAPPELAAWMAFVKAGGAQHGDLLPWLEAAAA